MAKQRKKTKKRPSASARNQKELIAVTEIWMAYERTRSVRATAAETGESTTRVRQVIENDHQRFQNVVDEFAEACIGHWEQKEAKSHAMIDGTLDLYAGLLLEVKAATEDGRLTTILDGDGNRYPVPNAMQFLLASRMLDQLVKIAQVGRALSEAYRGRSAADGNGKAGGGSGDDPSDWPAQRFIDVLRAGEMRVPKALEAKVASLLAD